jgi:hypothetical protein
VKLDIRGDTAFFRIVDQAKTVIMADDVIDELVDKGVEYVVMTAPSGRYTASIDDWLERADLSNVGFEMPLWRMTRG